MASPPVLTTPLDLLLARYRDHLTRERGVGAATVRGYADAVRPFLRTRLSPDGRYLDVQGLRSTDVTAFVVAHTPTQLRHAARMTVCSLRSVLRFLAPGGRDDGATGGRGALRRRMAAGHPAETCGRGVPALRLRRVDSVPGQRAGPGPSACRGQRGRAPARTATGRRLWATKSSTAVTCSRMTSNCSITSSTLRSSRFSMTVATGRRVPRNTQAPPTLSGTLSTRAL